MSASTGTASSASVSTTPAFWERLWRTAGIQSLGLFIIGYVIYGYQPHVGASADALAAFYDGDRTRILIAAVFFGLSILNLMWFAAALGTTLADAGQDGWGAATTASSAALGALSSCSSRPPQPSCTPSPAREITRSHGTTDIDVVVASGRRVMGRVPVTSNSLCSVNKSDLD